MPVETLHGCSMFNVRIVNVHHLNRITVRLYTCIFVRLLYMLFDEYRMVNKSHQTEEEHEQNFTFQFQM